MFQPRFTYTHRMVNLLLHVEQARTMMADLPLPPELIKTMRYDAKVKSVRYSTGIEGNPLDLAEVREAVRKPHDRQGSAAQQEARNYWNCLTFLDKAKQMKVAPGELLVQRLHALIEVRPAGRRQKVSPYRGPMPPGMLFAIRDSNTGEIDYIPPEYSDVPELMRNFSLWLGGSAIKELPVPIRAAIAAWQLLTIHPFSDGNGRAARAFAGYLLAVGDYDLHGVYSLEEYHWRDLPRYYASLQMGLPRNYYEGRNNPADLGPWIVYFLETMAQACNQVIETLQAIRKPEDLALSGLFMREKRLVEFMRQSGGDATPKVLSEIFSVSDRTLQRWAQGWVSQGILQPASGKQRITRYRLTEKYK